MYKKVARKMLIKFPPEWFVVIDEGFEEVDRHRKDDGRVLLCRNRVHSLNIKNTDDVTSPRKIFTKSLDHCAAFFS